MPKGVYERNKPRKSLTQQDGKMAVRVRATCRTCSPDFQYSSTQMANILGVKADSLLAWLNDNDFPKVIQGSHQPRYVTMRDIAKALEKKGFGKFPLP